VRHFRTVEELRLTLLEFQRQYNHAWLIERHGYRTPAEVRQSFTGCPETGV
jgi:putative transposase